MSTNHPAAPIPAPPPTPQEIQRKLSLHSAPLPSPGRRRANSAKGTNPPLSSTESDSDGPSSSYFSPPQALAASELSSSQPPLTAIMERRTASGEESEDDDEEEGEWQPGSTTAEIEEANEEVLVKSGYLWKKGERRKTWKKRWFVLRTGKLAYYKNNREYKLLHLLDLNDIHSVTPVSLKKHTNTFGIVTPTRTFYIQANNPSDCDAWVKALNDSRQRLKEELSTPGVPTPTAHANPQASPAALALSLERTPPRPINPPPPQVSVTHSGSYPRSITSQHQSPPSPIGGAFSSDSDDPYAPAATAAPYRPMTTDPKSVIFSGYLLKCGSKRKTWRKRWFMLTSEKLFYAKNHMDMKHSKAVPLDNVIDAIEFDLVSSKHAHVQGSSGGSGGGALSDAGGIGLVAGGGTVGSAAGSVGGEVAGVGEDEMKNTFKIITTRRPFLLCAPSEEEEIKWLSAVRALIARRTAAATGAVGIGALPGPNPGSTAVRESGGGGAKTAVRQRSQDA